MKRLSTVFVYSFSLLVATAQGQSLDTNLNTLLMPAARLAVVKAALPKVANSALVSVLNSPQTIWYDETVMKPSYQDSVGASSNDKWPDLVAAPESIIGGLHDRAKHRWQFPFATTAGTDDSTNLQVENFVYFPHSNGQLQTMPITKVHLNDNRPEWRWTYPAGTVFGEVLFITDGSKLLPTEIRTRTRYSTGWAMNVYRPFPRAADLADAIKLLRPSWNNTPSLSTMVAFLDDKSTLKPAKLSAKAALASSFQQDGYLDTLPDFGDDALVRELLTTTLFVSAYDTSWKQNGNQETFAASTESSMSIVPIHYTAGLIRVTDASCMRCHKDTNRLVSDYYGDLYLYGEMWGMDGIFSFHPYDERHYPELRFDMIDNRYLNPTLQQAKVFRMTFQKE